MSTNGIKDFKNIFANKEKFILLIDGNSGSGKTTFAEKLGKELDANVVSIDNYYLPFSKRKENWFEISGGNIDYLRLEKEVIEPYLNKEKMYLNKYNPHKEEYEFLGIKEYHPRLIIEGSYSFVDVISKYGTDKIFLKCTKDKQKKRLIKREKDHYKDFEDKWIKKEELYYADLNPEKLADYIIDTSNSL